MEQAVLAEKINYTYILRPSLITGGRKEKRTGEKIAINVFKLINPLMIGPLKKYKSINADSIAQALIYVANNDHDKSIIASDEIKTIDKMKA